MVIRKLSRLTYAFPAMLVALLPSPAFADDVLSAGDTAWMLTATALVLLMTIPGLALFYAGMVRAKNVLSVMMQCFAITALVTVLWTVIGYSLAFTDGGGMNDYLGGMSKLFLAGVTGDALSGTIPETVFMTFQMTFAIITPALIVGAFAERMKFSAMLWFMGLWLVLVYGPVAHWVWGGGWLADKGVLDFAGGTVVHINAGIAGFVAALSSASRLTPPTSSLVLPRRAPTLSFELPRPEAPASRSLPPEAVARWERRQSEWRAGQAARLERQERDAARAAERAAHRARRPGEERP